MSLHGAALELAANVSAPKSRLVLLEVQYGQETGVVLRARVRSLNFTPNGHHRIGLRFVNVTSVEHQFLVDMINRSKNNADGTTP